MTRDILSSSAGEPRVRLYQELETTFLAPTVPAATEAAQQIVDRVYPYSEQPAKELPASGQSSRNFFEVDPAAALTVIKATTGETDGPRANFIGFHFEPQTDSTVLLSVNNQPYAGMGQVAAIAEAITTPDVELLARARNLQLWFDSGAALAAHAEVINVPITSEVVQERARRQAFRHINDIVVGESDNNTQGERLFALIQEHMPSMEVEIGTIQEQLKVGALDKSHYLGALQALSRKAYMEMKLESQRKTYLEAMAMRLRELFPGYTFPGQIDFHMLDLQNPMNANQLEASFPWPGEVTDERFQVTGRLAINGIYSLPSHEFALRDDIPNPQAGLSFWLARRAATPDQTEAALGTALDAQLRILGGTALSEERFATYQDHWVTPPAADIVRPGQRHLLRTERMVRKRFTQMPSAITQFFLL